jgi:hypothetical protein
MLHFLKNVCGAFSDSPSFCADGIHLQFFISISAIFRWQLAMPIP